MKNIFTPLKKRKSIEESVILLAGTARNVAEHIENEVLTLLQSFDNFKKIYCLIVESDSNDLTLNKLRQLRERISNFEILSLGALAKTMPKRTERLAYCRNKVIDQVRTNPAYQDVDFIVMADLDGVNLDLNSKKIASCWSSKINWDVVTANQGDIYYDIWALRHPYWSPVDCIQQARHLEKIFSERAANNLAVWAKMIYLPEDRGFIPVDSAFGGLGIYKREAFLVGTYRGLSEDGVEICEHVYFHSNLRQAGYHIYINAALINCECHPTDSPTIKRPRLRSTLGIGITQRLGNCIFGKKRFNKYLDLLKNNDV